MYMRRHYCWNTANVEIELVNWISVVKARQRSRVVKIVRIFLKTACDLRRLRFDQALAQDPRLWAAYKSAPAAGAVHHPVLPDQYCQRRPLLMSKSPAWRW